MLFAVVTAITRALFLKVAYQAKYRPQNDKSSDYNINPVHLHSPHARNNDAILYTANDTRYAATS